MDAAGLIVYVTALAVAAASPGPGIAAIVARVLGRGARGAVPFAAGVALGDVVWLGLAVGGLSVLAQTFHAVFVAKWAGVAYLAWLAWRMWTAPAIAHELPADARRERPGALFAAGLAVTLGNPKVMVFYVALLPTLVDVARVDATAFVQLAAATLAVLALVFGAWIGLAARARRLFSSPRALRRMRRGSAGAMVGAAAWIASR